MLTLLKDLFRPPARSAAAPRCNPDDPCGDGWRRSDLPQGRPVRYRLAVPSLPRTPPPPTNSVFRGISGPGYATPNRQRLSDKGISGISGTGFSLAYHPTFRFSRSVSVSCNSDLM